MDMLDNSQDPVTDQDYTAQDEENSALQNGGAATSDQQVLGGIGDDVTDDQTSRTDDSIIDRTIAVDETDTIDTTAAWRERQDDLNAIGE